MNISVISSKITNSLTNELDYSEDKKEIISYAIETAFLSIIGTILIICLGYSLNVLIPAVTATVFGGLLRKLSGGAHFNTPLKCLVFGTLIYCFIGVLAKKLVILELIGQNILITIALVSLLLVSLLAPVDSDAKPIHSRRLRMKLKIASICFVLISILVILVTNNPLISLSAVLGLLYQSITLLPIFNRRGGEKRL